MLNAETGGTRPVAILLVLHELGVHLAAERGRPGQLAQGRRQAFEKAIDIVRYHYGLALTNGTEAAS